jgi:hypothetical protein
MSRKYIGQQSDYNFVYPNNDPKQYDVEIVHDINDNSVSGTVTNFTGTSISTTGMTISFNWSWTKNGAEPFISDSGNINLLSVHMMSGDQNYFKPWRLVEYENNATTGSTSYTGTTSFTVLPSQIGLTAFVNDDYYFEIRFIGHRAIYPICQTLVVSSIVPPTPTPSPTSATPTPTPTPTVTPTAVNYTSGATLNVTDTGWLKYDMSSGTTYQFIGSTGTVTLTNCLICDSIRDGIPFADLATFTVTNCGTSCSPPSPTPAPSPEPISYVYYVLTDCQTYETKYSQQLVDGTYDSGDRVMGSFGYYYVVSGSVVSTPDPSLIFFVTATGEYGCP